MKAGELVKWRRAWMISRSQLADLLDVHVGTVHRWEKGESRIPGMVPLALETIAGQRRILIRSLRRQREDLRRQQSVAS